jgi:hypothetical protein
MKIFNFYRRKVVMSCFAVTMMSASVNTEVFAEEDKNIVVAFPDKWMIRAGAYLIDDTKTQVSVNSNLFGLGTTIDYQKDLASDALNRHSR